MRGAAGLLILLLIPLLILIAIFAFSKFIVPNPETVQESNRIEENAQDAVNQIQQKSKESQSQEID